MILEVLLLIILLGFSFAFSGSETALFSIKKTQMNTLLSENPKLHRSISDMQKKSTSFLLTILVSNNLVNIAASTLSLKIFMDLGIANYQVYNFAVMSIIVIIFGEILPKTIALNRNIRFVSKMSPPLYFASSLFFPLNFIISKVALFFLSINSFFLGATDHDLEKGELFSLLSRIKGEASGAAQTINRNFFRLMEQDPDSIIIHRNDIKGLNLSDPEYLIKESLKRTDHRFITVFSENIDNVLGIYDLYSMFEKSGENIKDHIRKNLIQGLFYPIYTNPEKLLKGLGKYGRPVFLVDEYGGIEGLLTIEHIVDMLTLRDDEFIKKVSNSTYVVNPQITVFEMEVFFQMDIFKEEGSNTLIEVFLDRLGRMPKKGDSVTFQGANIEVEKTDGYQVISFKVKVDNG